MEEVKVTLGDVVQMLSGFEGMKSDLWAVSEILRTIESTLEDHGKQLARLSKDVGTLKKDVGTLKGGQERLEKVTQSVYKMVNGMREDLRTGVYHMGYADESLKEAGQALTDALRKIEGKRGRWVPPE